MAAPDALRFRVCIGPRSPLHAALAEMPVEERAAALLRWAEAGMDAGTAAPQGPPPSSPVPSAAGEGALVMAVLRLAAAVAQLTGGSRQRWSVQRRVGGRRIRGCAGGGAGCGLGGVKGAEARYNSTVSSSTVNPAWRRMLRKVPGLSTLPAWTATVTTPLPPSRCRW